MSVMACAHPQLPWSPEFSLQESELSGPGEGKWPLTPSWKPHTLLRLLQLTRLERALIVQTE